MQDKQFAQIPDIAAIEARAREMRAEAMAAMIRGLARRIAALLSRRVPAPRSA
ncbi:MAG: RSP_7527 family protein [Gemmobacter sp.]